MCFVGFVALRLKEDAVKWVSNALIARCCSYLSCNAYACIHFNAFPPFISQQLHVHIILKDAYGSVVICVLSLIFPHMIFIFHMSHFLLVLPFARWLLSECPSEVYGYTVSS